MKLDGALTLADFCEEAGLAPASARVQLSRLVKRGALLRVRRNFYLTPQALSQATEAELFHFSNLIQTPSYISFSTALAYHGWSTQLSTGLIEAMNPIRSKEYRAREIIFRYHYCRPEFYSGYEKMDNFFMATPEKALLDALYLTSLGRYALDLSALERGKINWNRLEVCLKKYPPRVRDRLKDWRKKFEITATP